VDPTWAAGEQIMKCGFKKMTLPMKERKCWTRSITPKPGAACIDARLNHNESKTEMRNVPVVKA
jgi:hypothetical protein